MSIKYIVILWLYFNTNASIMSHYFENINISIRSHDKVNPFIYT